MISLLIRYGKHLLMMFVRVKDEKGRPECLLLVLPRANTLVVA